MSIANPFSEIFRYDNLCILCNVKSVRETERCKVDHCISSEMIRCSYRLIWIILRFLSLSSLSLSFSVECLCFMIWQSADWYSILLTWLFANDASSSCELDEQHTQFRHTQWRIECCHRSCNLINFAWLKHFILFCHCPGAPHFSQHEQQQQQQQQ